MLAPVLLMLALALGDAPDAGQPVDPAPDAGESVEVAKTEKKALQIEAVAAAIARMKKAAGALTDFTAVFYKSEWRSGKQLPAEVIQFKYRAEPRGIYFKWIGEHYKNQEVIWQKGANDDRMRAHQGHFPDITVNLPTTHWLALRNTRHEIVNAGFDFTIEMFARDLFTGRAKPECVIRTADVGSQTILNARAHCYELETDKEKCPEMYSYKARLCLNVELGLPARIEVWDKEDGELRLVEDYGYGDVKVNVGLTDADFDSKNKSYDF